MPRKKRRSTPTRHAGVKKVLMHRRTKKEQERLIREIISVFAFVFGLMSLIVMYKSQGEFGYGLREFLVGTFGVGSWLISLISFYITVLLLLPAKFWERGSRILWALLIGLMALGLLELGKISSGYMVATTRGGIIGYAVSKLLSSVLGTFFTGVVEIALIVVSLIVLTNWSLTNGFTGLQKALSMVREKLADAWEWLKVKWFQKFGDDEDDALIEHNVAADEAVEEDAEAIAAEEDEIVDDSEGPYVEPSTVSFKKHALAKAEATPPDFSTTVLPAASQAKTIHPSVWFLPTIDLLDPQAKSLAETASPHLRKDIINRTLKNFGVEASVVGHNIGPTITQYELKLEPGVKVAKITALQNDLALALSTSQIRIEAPIPGKPYIGIEVPNYVATTVNLRGLIQTSEFQNPKKLLPMALGRNVSGDVFVSDLTNAPHALIAGATGSGKSVCINSVISSFLYKYNPDELKLIMVDPKVVELSRFNGIPHLLTPVITRPDKTLSALKWAIDEMERRYQIFASHGVRNIESYNKAQRDAMAQLPYIVIIVDELADLMMASPVEVEESICRLAQKARATGLHLIIATQRPSVNVVTGLIKANIPTRICFAVASQMDSRVVLDQNGAEKLLGRGDMLYHAPDLGKMVRLQGVFVSDTEVERLVQFWSKQGEPTYLDEVISQPVNMKNGGGSNDDDMDDELLQDALNEIVREGRGSASLLQRRLRVGYARAARLIDILENKGCLSPADGSKPREVLKRSLPTGNVRETPPPAAFPQTLPPAKPIDDSESLFDEYES